MRRLPLLPFVLAAIFVLAGNAFAESKKFRIGYLEAGQYWAYEGTIKAMQTAMTARGWGPDRVEYPADAWFSPGWDEEKVPEYLERAKELMARDGLDLIVAMGTAAAGALLEANNGRTPILGMALSDPVKSGFVPSLEDSGVDNFTVRIVRDRWKIMFELFHEIVGFKKLGIIYPDTETGLVYANVLDARQAAKERGFELLEYNQIGTTESTEDCRKGIEDLLARGMDAFFISALNCFDWGACDVNQLFELLNRHKIPTFARDGSTHVRSGALMAFSTQDFSPIGEFLANSCIRILEGEKPRDLPMVDNSQPKIALNIETAQKIGFDFPVNILIASDEIYEKSVLPEGRKFQ
ncbi:MAG: hypothetical protein EOM25_06745 [Deltaproteobacteria bacterium]|nr:hypothetical protein [Deltaproteobacteria bacterium]